MKTTLHRSAIAAVVAAFCIGPAAFAKHPKDEQENQGAPGAPGGQNIPQGKQKKQGKSAPQAVVVPSGAGPRGPGGAGPSRPMPQRVPERFPGVRVVVPPPPFPPPQPYSHRSYRRSSTPVVDSDVSSVQRALKQRGYYSGPVDGDAGSGTRAAIRGFREDNGLGGTSVVDAPLLRALGL